MTSVPHQIRLLFSRKLLETLRTPAWVVVGLSTPLLYLALFAPLLEPLSGGPGFPHGDVLDVFVPGILVIPALLVILIAEPFGYHPDWGGIAVLLILLSLLTAPVSAWSNALGMILKEIGSLAAIVTGLQLPLTLLSGVLLPLSIAPDWMQLLAHVNPLYYAVTAARKLSEGTIVTADVGTAFLVIGALTIVTLAWATRVYREAVA